MSDQPQDTQAARAQAASPRICARCSYDLASLITGVPIITCPECGARGTPEQICEPQLPPLPHWTRIAAYLTGPTVALCLVCAALAAVGAGPVQFFVVSFTVVSGPVVPCLVGDYMADRHRPRRRRARLAYALIAVGMAANLVIGVVFLYIGALILEATAF